MVVCLSCECCIQFPGFALVEISNTNVLHALFLDLVLYNRFIERRSSVMAPGS